jgi:hypothetical protein
MRVGGRSADWGNAGMRAALEDPEVGAVAAQLHAARDILVLDYTMYALAQVSTDKMLPALRTTLRGASLAAATTIAPIAANWRSTLAADDLAYRKGAVIQRLVERLLKDRPMTVHPERRIVFSNGERTVGMDVIGVPPKGPWEAHECKAGSFLPNIQAKELTWMARTAARVGDDLLVVLTSAESTTAVEQTLGDVLEAELLFYVARETIFFLDAARPSAQISRT